AWIKYLYELRNQNNYPSRPRPAALYSATPDINPQTAVHCRRAGRSMALVYRWRAYSGLWTGAGLCRLAGLWSSSDCPAGAVQPIFLVGCDHRSDAYYCVLSVWYCPKRTASNEITHCWHRYGAYAGKSAQS